MLSVLTIPCTTRPQATRRITQCYSFIYRTEYSGFPRDSMSNAKMVLFINEYDITSAFKDFHCKFLGIFGFLCLPSCRTDLLTNTNGCSYCFSLILPPLLSKIDKY